MPRVKEYVDLIEWFEENDEITTLNDMMSRLKNKNKISKEKQKKIKITLQKAFFNKYTYRMKRIAFKDRFKFKTAHKIKKYWYAKRRHYSN